MDIMWAAHEGEEGCVKISVEAGANRSITNDQGEMAIDLLASTEAIKAILRCESMLLLESNNYISVLLSWGQSRRLKGNKHT